MSALVGVLAVLTPKAGKVVDSSMWQYDRTVAADMPDLDVSDEIFTIKATSMIHVFKTTLFSKGDRPRVALIDADELEEARAAIAELIEALKDARAALDNVGLIDTYIDFDAVQAASDRADAALAAVGPK